MKIICLLLAVVACANASCPVLYRSNSRSRDFTLSANPRNYCSRSYEDNMDCSYTLVASTDYNRPVYVNFTVLDFNLEHGYDFVYVTYTPNGRNWPQTVSLTGWQGSFAQGGFIAPRTAVTIRFRTDYSITRTGFQLGGYIRE